MKINQSLLWDAEWKPEEYCTERFRRWYVGRVLSNGTADDLRGLEEVFDEIPRLLPELRLPRSVRRFWDWYVKEFHGLEPDPHTASTRPAQPA